MAKDPAFLFYTKDFLSGISDLTMEERGQYITLLCLQHQKGHLSDKVIRLCLGNAAADVMAKFRQDPAGFWYNERLEQEIEKRKKHTDKQKERAIEGWKKRKNQTLSDTTANAAALPLVNVNANGIVDVDYKLKGEIFEKLFSDEMYIGDLSMTHRGKDLQKAFDECYIHHSNAPNPPGTLGEWKQKLNTWLSNTKHGTTKNKRKEQIGTLAENLANRVRLRTSGGET